MSWPPTCILSIFGWPRESTKNCYKLLDLHWQKSHELDIPSVQINGYVCFLVFFFFFFFFWNTVWAHRSRSHQKTIAAITWQKNLKEWVFRSRHLQVSYKIPFPRLLNVSGSLLKLLTCNFISIETLTKILSFKFWNIFQDSLAAQQLRATE